MPDSDSALVQLVLLRQQSEPAPDLLSALGLYPVLSPLLMPVRKKLPKLTDLELVQLPERKVLLPDSDSALVQLVLLRQQSESEPAPDLLSALGLYPVLSPLLMPVRKKLPKPTGLEPDQIPVRKE